MQRWPQICRRITWITAWKPFPESGHSCVAGFEPIPATPLDKIELAVRKLDEKKSAWVHTSAQDRASLLRRTLQTTLQVMKTAATVSTHAKGIYGAGVGEE